MHDGDRTGHDPVTVRIDWSDPMTQTLAIEGMRELHDPYLDGFKDGYGAGWVAAVAKYEDEESDESALTFSNADLTLMGVAFLALLIPIGILLSNTGRPRWKLPWN
jgi:hypothetical protein